MISYWEASERRLPITLRVLATLEYFLLFDFLICFLEMGFWIRVYYLKTFFLSKF